MHSFRNTPVERRAIAARLSALVSAFVLLAAFASTASAASPKSPKLLGSDPLSTASAPATSTSLSIMGEAEPEDGIIIETTPFTPDGLVPNATKNPEYEIRIFSGSTCAGSAVATGTAAELEGAGIAVTAAANAKSIFSADQVDPTNPSEPSPCSNALSYWEGEVPAEETSGGGGTTGGGGGGGTTTTGPPATSTTPVGTAPPASPTPLKAPHIHTSPGGRANNSTPLVVGSAPGAAAVTLYAGANCATAPLAQLSPGQLTAGFPVAVAANAETTFSAIASAEGKYSACSENVFYFDDSSAPRTRITMGPGVKTRKRKVVFRFVDITQDSPGTTFACRADRAKWKACSSPFRLAHLKFGQHVVAIRATDTAGNVETKPVKSHFKVVRP